MKKVLMLLIALLFSSCYTIKSTVINHLVKKYPSKYYIEQQRIKDSIKEKGHKVYPLTKPIYMKNIVVKKQEYYN